MYYQIFTTAENNFHAEELMRDACTELGSLAGICVNPLYGSEARRLPQNSYSLGTSKFALLIHGFSGLGLTLMFLQHGVLVAPLLCHGARKSTRSRHC
jgi:hypothetical protein